MSVLCLGPKSAGKTHLLSSLQHPGTITSTSHSVPTVGTNIFSIELPGRNGAKAAAAPVKTTGKRSAMSSVGPAEAVASKAAAQQRTVKVREVGGTMAPMWRTYLNDVAKIVYVVDTSNLCQISAAGVLLYSLLADPRLQRTQMLIVLTKMDLAYRQMRNEALLMLQLDKLRKQIRQPVTVIEASALTDLGHAQIVQWLAK